MDDTQNLKLPYIIAAQAQKHVTHNEALKALDAIVHLAVLDRDLTTPPVAANDGDRYIIAAGATGAWQGKDGQIAAWQDGAWAYYSPNAGWLAWIEDEDALCVFEGSTWSVASNGGGASVNPTPLVGVNATADTTNRLSINAPASLFNHEGNGHQQKINKASSGDTASQLYQTNFSGRAEIGLTGDDDFHFKVSPDGTTFHEAIIIDNGDGKVSFPNSAFTDNMLFNLFEDAGRFGGAPEDQTVSVGSYVAPNYLNVYNGSVFAAGDKFIFNNSTYGGTGGALGTDVDELIVKLKGVGGSNNYKRYGPEFYVLNITVGNGTNGPLTIGATTYHLCLSNDSVPFWPKSTFIYNLKVKSGQAAIGTESNVDLYIDGVYQASPVELTSADGWVQVVRRHNIPVDTFLGYASTLLRLYATNGSVVAIALPTLFPGQYTPTAEPVGVISSLRGWR